MAYKSSGKAGKSASGASMSKYDVEVEARLQALEADAHPKCEHGASGGGDVDLSKRVEIIETILRMNPEMNFDKLVSKLS
jgi:hypothetical protein|tara:strand:- start:177 stop:416 length:240 start_codon:yes stop_codon:yes gene_type:complete